MSQELTECPQCQAIWGFDEIEFQECDDCEYQALKDDADDLIPPDLSGQGNSFGTGIGLNWN